MEARAGFSRTGAPEEPAWGRMRCRAWVSSNLTVARAPTPSRRSGSRGRPRRSTGSAGAEPPAFRSALGRRGVRPEPDERNAHRLHTTHLHRARGAAALPTGASRPLYREPPSDAFPIWSGLRSGENLASRKPRGAHHPAVQSLHVEPERHRPPRLDSPASRSADRAYGETTCLGLSVRLPSQVNLAGPRQSSTQSALCDGIVRLVDDGLSVPLLS
jgi:hypothetical protein